MNKKYEVTSVILNGKPGKKFKCPDCNVLGYIDDDQYNGRISIQCSCGFHKTLNLKELLK